MRFTFLRFTAQPCLVIALTLLSRVSMFAELEVNPLFSDHAVLQQSQPVPVWGKADPGQKVVVTFSGQSRETKTEESGKWMVKLDPLTASYTGQDLAIRSGGKTITITDILVGEVWICSGQSNMAMNLRSTTEADSIAEEARKEKFKGIRLFKVPVAGADNPQTAVEAAWSLPNPANIAQFSATAFYFGRALNRDKDFPVGLIQSANGGTNAYSWINLETMANHPAAETARNFWENTVARAPVALERYKQKKEAWLSGGKKGNAPREPLNPTHVKRPTGHYNAMVAPLQPYAIRGAIWYQGEANSRPPFVTGYRDLMSSLVDGWRSDWHAAAGGKAEESPEKFPFYLVQLPNYKPGAAWPVIREQMLKFWQEGDETGMVVSIDVGDPTNIHPANKMPIGERLARFARANTYGNDIVYSGPVYESMTVEGNVITLNFKHTGGGLKSLDGKPLTNFKMADSEGNFAPASSVEIDGNSLKISAADIAQPRAVRYAWSPNPENLNFVNGEDLPASPFRTDSWDLFPAGE